MDKHRIELQRLVERFEDRLRLARATELATCKRFLEAEALICPGGRQPGTADEFDLLARIHVQQGRFDLAKKRWSGAAMTGERRGEFEECLIVLDEWLDDRERLLLLRIVLGLWLLTLLWWALIAGTWVFSKG